MELLVIVAVAGGIFLLVMWRKKPKPPPSRASVGRRTPMPQSPPSTVVAVEVSRPSLPAGVEAQIVAALKRGEDPDEEWMHGPQDGSGGLRMAPYAARFQSVSGETFANSGGVSRQEILKRASVGQLAWLIPEPTNEYDSSAVAVYLDFGNGNTGQIGYLPRDHNMSGDLAANKVSAWLARVGARRAGAPLGAALYVACLSGCHP